MCAVARQDVCCDKVRSLLWQDTREPQRGAAAEGGRPPLWRRPKAASLVSCHNRGLVLSQQTSCLATAHILSCRDGSLCGKTRCALWQDKITVVARQKHCCDKTQGRRPLGRLHKGGRPPSAAAPFVVPLCLATTEVSSCHNRHLVLPQRTSFLAAPDIRRGKRGCKLPMFFGHNSTLVAPFGASMGAK